MTFDVDFFIKTFFVCLKAVPVALEITAVTLMISLPVGFCFAFLRIKSGFAINGLITAYISLVRGTPIVVQILVLYSMLPSILASLLKGINSPINVYDVDPIYYAYVIFSLNTTAILSEVFRSALSTVQRTVGSGRIRRAYDLSGVPENYYPAGDGYGSPQYMYGNH
ncbi:ABC transporter permease subunit [Paenibacillus naphthalenovorans]|uniref:ABC transporter permease subunit n=1 Tax=Paenibacillus naphthalenovorans TaxID=162209 RepID=UPI000887564B|nr:ABC transporter permease subunit [Paenibacillus naphthalenovorans]SDJ14486.1 L-cystine transport system permease protein [Paenibacillus naphthalenovorans]